MRTLFTSLFLVTLLSVNGIAQTTGAASPGTPGNQTVAPSGTPSGQPHGTAGAQGSTTGGNQSGQPMTGSGEPGSMTGSGTNSPAVERSYTGTSGMQSEAYGTDRDRDGFNFGWLGLLGLAGLLGLRHPRREYAATNTAIR